MKVTGCLNMPSLPFPITTESCYGESQERELLITKEQDRVQYIWERNKIMMSEDTMDKKNPPHTMKQYVISKAKHWKQNGLIGNILIPW